MVWIPSNEELQMRHPLTGKRFRNHGEVWTIYEVSETSVTYDDGVATEWWVSYFRPTETANEIHQACPLRALDHIKVFF